MVNTASVVLQTVEEDGLVFQAHTGSGGVEEAIRLSDTKYCSVHATLAPAVEIVSRFEIIPA